MSSIGDLTRGYGNKTDLLEALVKKARDLGEVVRTCRDEIDAAHELPARVVSTLRESGLFRLFVPKAFGGYEVDPITFTQIIEEIAALDGSVGWVLSVGAVGGLFAGSLPESVARQIYGRDPDAIFAGGITPTGTAAVVNGGFMLSGRWAFGSGIRHANWVYGNCVVCDEGQPRLTPAGGPEARLMIFPVSDCQIHDTWHVGGLRGTGSHHFSVQDLFVPADWSLVAFSSGQASQPGLLYKYPFSLFAAMIAAVPLGIAKRSISALIELAKAKIPVGSGSVLRDRPSAQFAVARAEGLYRSGRAFLLEALAEMEREIARCGQAGMQSRVLLRIACTQAALASTQVVDLMFEAGGGTSVYTSSPLERCFRDIHAAMQHIAVSPNSLETAGRVLFGLDPGTARF